MKEIDNRQWRREYPGMPDSFHQALCREVERQMKKSGKKIVGVHRASGRKSLRGAAMRGAVAAALVTLGGMTAFAGAKLRLPELFGWQFTAKQEEQLIQTEPEVSQPETVHISGGMKENMELVEAWPALPDSSSLLDIRETLFDGVKLYVYGIPTENGSNYELNADRLYVNETEVGPVSTSHLYPGDALENIAAEEEMYIFQVDLSKLELSDPFEVTLPLSVYEKPELGGAAISSDEADSYTAPVRYQN